MIFLEKLNCQSDATVAESKRGELFSFAMQMFYRIKVWITDLAVNVGNLNDDLFDTFD